MATINTEGGAYIGGNVNTGGGKIYPRDRVVYGDEVKGNNVIGSKIVINTASNSSSTEEPEQIVDMSGLPEGSILHRDFVGGRLQHGSNYYRLMQPLTKRNGKFVYVKII